MAWSTREKAPLARAEKRDTPDGLWMRCKSCQSVIFKTDFEKNKNVCLKCSFHYALPAMSRIEAFLDAGSFQEMDRELASDDPLQFSDSKSYRDRLVTSQTKLNRKDAIITGTGTLRGRNVAIGVFDFGFMGGSMGSVVGEKIARVFLHGAKEKMPCIIVSSSGGARMQEGVLSLMQMAKTCAALTRLRDAGMPFFSILTNPTTGGVAASFAMLGDINIGEPGALIGFAGPRVIKQTIRQDLPEGFQTAEYLLDHGMLDLICHRDTQRDTISRLIRMIVPS